ncbi:hypothetical protein PG990_008813 [Apiospora arundinis]
MPPETRKIPQSDWDRHQSTIRALYHSQKLPLWKQNGDRCVISVMRGEHGFDASLSQYEAQLRRWDSQKNLKRHEWAFLLSRYDTLSARGCKVRIVSSGLPLLESRILRARRHLQSTGHAAHTISEPRQAFVEYQNSKKDWVRYSPANQAPESDQTGTQVSATLAQGGSGSHGPASPTNDVEDDVAPLDWLQETSLVLRQEAVHSTPNLGLNLDLGRLHPQKSTGAPDAPGGAHALVDVTRLGISTPKLRPSHPRRIIQPPRRDLVATAPFRPLSISVDPAINIIMHPVAQHLLGQISCLTPHNTRTSSLALSTRDLRSDVPTLVKAIAYSISNRTGMLPRSTHHGTVFSLMRQSESLQRGWQDFLKSVQPSVGMCLADNLFRHAVETGDSQATKMILEMAQSNFKYSINPNLIKCTILERAGHFTPLEVAAVKRNLELTRVLLGVEADPNHTYWQGFEHSQGALEHALWTSVRPPNAPPPVNIKLVHLLLDHQAQFMLPMVPFAYLQELLVLAIRSGETRLVDRLLQVGATVDGPATATITVSGSPGPGDEKLPFVERMTPLAEAIRCQDDILVRRLEDLGALSCITIGKETHFRAAATAAAYVGNLAYLRRICEKGSQLDGALLSNALTAAIACDHFEIACFITHHFPAGTSSVESAFGMAICRRNKAAFDLLVPFICGRLGNLSGMMADGVLWGNIEILDCLVRLGEDVNDNGGEELNLPLTIAALIGDKTILRWLLDHGAVPGPGFSFELSPLAIAALHGDTEMVDILLAHHASVRDELALSFAMTYSQKAFETLLSEFRSKFPKGLPGFGSNLLNKAMHDAKVHQIRRLLEAGMDPSTPARTLFSYESHEIEHLHEERGNGWRCRILDESALLKRIGELSPLGYAISMDVHGRLNRISIVRMLLEAGADPNRRVGDYCLQTSFLLAVEQEDIDIIRLLAEYRADVNLRPYGTRYSPLQQACQQGSLDVVMFLLQQGADVQAAPSPAQGGTALQMASQSGNVKLAQLLIDNGADVCEPPAQVGGRTSFEGAAEEGRITMLEFLWDQACPAGFPRAELERARSLAEEEGHRGCVEYIDLLLMIVGNGMTPRLSAG